ncbi:MAG: hypothetical protein SFU53_02650 [Terrimicrobiaceae bacterium]|nr:hypothetical protein [Terrimicrobiaceae bacterium]
MIGAVVFALALSACPAPVEPTKTPAKQAAPPDASISRPAVLLPPMEGVWSAMDEQGQTFDLILFPNGQAITTWTKGASGARGERGWWRSTADGATIFFDDGWTDFVVQDGSSFRHRGFSPGRPTSGQATNESAARRIEGPEAAYVGIWWLNKEPDGSDLYVALQSGGRAFSTINPGEGKWTATDEGALCEWSDGWTDLITLTPEGYRKRSWVGSRENATPADISPVRRVGAEKFSVAP